MSYRLRKAIAESGSPLQAYDQDKWANALYYDKADCKQKVNLFFALRGANAALLQCLSSKEWQRYGLHAERGEETVERMVQMTQLLHTSYTQRSIQHATSTYRGLRSVVL